MAVKEPNITVRPAIPDDADRMIELLHQVLEIHAALRPDLFISGTTKYTKEQVVAHLNNENRRCYTAVDQDGRVVGYALCELRKQPASANMTAFDSLYIDDLCVDGEMRGSHVGTQLFEYVKKEARALGCYEISLNVWEGNRPARAFYDRMGMTPKKTEMEFILSETEQAAR